MTSSQMHLGDALCPSHAYADGWPAYAQERWTQYREAYRERVRTVYAALAEEQPASFKLLEPVEVLVVASILGEWMFVRPAGADAITLDPRWEDPRLDRRENQGRADLDQLVRQVAAVSTDFTLLNRDNYTARFNLSQAPDAASSNPHYFGREQADLDAAAAIQEPELQALIDAVMGRTIDTAALDRLRAQLATIEPLAPRQRGTAFEKWFAELLQAHGCEVESGGNRQGEQVDLFVHTPFRAIVECRWKRHRLQPRELADLTAKLSRRPAIVAGIYVAWSGFTDNCRNQAAQEPYGRTVLLWDETDIRRLLDGTTHAHDLFEEHVSDRVRRYHRDA